LTFSRIFNGLWRSKADTDLGRATRRQMLLRQNAIQRWACEANLAPAWDGRTQVIARLIPEDSRVIEFGAGRRSLEKMLPHGCVYTPSDLVPRGSGCLVIDLNRRIPNLGCYDVAVFSGVLEYVYDVPGVIRRVAEFSNMIVASYAVTDFTPKLRRNQGWVNDFSGSRFRNLLARSGFSEVQEIRWRTQFIFAARQARA